MKSQQSSLPAQECFPLRPSTRSKAKATWRNGVGQLTWPIHVGRVYGLYGSSGNVASVAKERFGHCRIEWRERLVVLFHVGRWCGRMWVKSEQGSGGAQAIKHA